MKKIVALIAVLLLSGSMLFAQNVKINFDVISGRRPPNPAEAHAMRAEELAHPNITVAMNKVEESIQLLNQAGEIFGGHKAEALDNLQRALISLKKALYYRIYQDH